MKFEVYCDESHPDVFSSSSPAKGKFLMIGSLWLPADLRPVLKKQIGSLKKEFAFSHEIKWHKVHASREEFYQSLINLFLSHGELLRFRCIAVESGKIDLVNFHNNDQELGFFKFYYQVLQHWILAFNKYVVFCDAKTNRDGGRFQTLQKVLRNANLSSDILSVQALPSHEVLLLQLTDFLLGMASSRLNESVEKGSIKDRLIEYLEKRLDRQRLEPTSKSEQKFNIFKIHLEGGW